VLVTLDSWNVPTEFVPSQEVLRRQEEVGRQKKEEEEQVKLREQQVLLEEQEAVKLVSRFIEICEC